MGIRVADVGRYVAAATPVQGVAVLGGPGADDVDIGFGAQAELAAHGVRGQWRTHHTGFGQAQPEVVLKRGEREKLLSFRT